MCRLGNGWVRDAKICSLGMYNLMIDHDNVIDLVHLMPGVFTKQKDYKQTKHINERNKLIIKEMKLL